MTRLTTALEALGAVCAVVGDVLLFGVSLPAALLAAAVILFAAAYILATA